MASRRDELNAYTFAKRRTLASFLQPSPSGSEEGAPKPLSALVPGLVVGVVILAVFGAIGMFSPTAPKGWDAPGEHVIVASKSTTRYVVLKTGKQTQLHPVLNMASARLLLDPDKNSVITVDEKVLDSGKPLARRHHRHPVRPRPAALRLRGRLRQALGGVRTPR
ncbi:hypothetical protein GCM10020256_18950 [Streptomyces thermocoprophilus]